MSGDKPLFIFPEGQESQKEQEVPAADRAFSVDSLRAMVTHMNEINDDIKLLQNKRKQLIADYIDEYNIPKKEVMAAIKMLKSHTDIIVVEDIYANIADLVEQ